jgi:molybdopterin/thiamine biosynthesis adenylyltransferase
MPNIKPKILLFSHQLELIRKQSKKKGMGIARCIDISHEIPEVVHLFPLEYKSNSIAKETIPMQWNVGTDLMDIKKNKNRPHAFLFINDAKKELTATCDLILENAEFLDLDVEIIPTGSSSFTRNKAILESSLLNSSTVLCIGLGSGGSVVIDQLARAGIGHFILWDMDRLESHNIGRHICTLDDIGRRKVFAVHDHIKSINPNAKVKCIDKDVISRSSYKDLEQAINTSDLIIVATDNNASRYTINDVAWQQGKTAIYGRAFIRALGGDVIQVIPGLTPCYACHTGNRVVDEEISSQRDVDRVAYADTVVPIEPGLVIDIHPIANMVARLALLKLCINKNTSLNKVAEETDAPLYLWANRREGQFENWQPMERTYSRLSILRWYAISVKYDKKCMTCGYSHTD